VFLEAVDEVISEILGHDVLGSLYVALEKQYDVTKDEIPYRMDTVYKILREIFGVQGSTTLTERIVRRLYENLNLEFEEVDGLQLMDYVEIAKRKLPQKQATKRFVAALKKFSRKRDRYGTPVNVREETELTGPLGASNMLVLNALNEKEEMKIDEVAQRVRMPIPTTQRRVDDMIERMLIVRFVRVNGTHYSITKLGKSALLRYDRKPKKNDPAKSGNDWSEPTQPSPKPSSDFLSPHRPVQW
jgi:DNA-binding MarR family transcriptional regulator